MKKTIIISCILVLFLLTGCSRFDSMKDTATAPAPVVVEQGKTVEEDKTQENETESEPESEEIIINQEPERIPVQVKGIYISAYVAGTTTMVDNLIAEIDRTEVNALVIDLKDDFGRVSCNMDSPIVNEVGSVKAYIQDVGGLLDKLKEHHIYAIARIPAFRDAWLGEHKPEWCVRKADGTLFQDRDGNTWVNPYKKEAWDYLIEIATEAKKAGFDEVQFDYVRFCTEKGMNDAVFDEADVQGRSKTDIICEFMAYAYDKLKAEGLFVSADVFGAIINSSVNANSVGQIYGEMAKHLDYISPMIYPSHYTDGNYGIDHPDMHPYETITAALADSKKELYFAGRDGSHIAEVRPWLQDFTASWLTNHIPYGAKEVREQIQATYDQGYDEWLLWDAACKYDWDGLLTPEEAEAEKAAIAESRAALPETTFAEPTTAPPETTAPAETAAPPSETSPEVLPAETAETSGEVTADGT